MHDPNREAVRKRLEALHFTVGTVPEVPNEKRPDLVALKGNTTMFVEVKTRVEDTNLRAKMESVGIGEAKSFLMSLDKHNSLSVEVERADARHHPVKSCIEAV
jgi:Holliday junction resolvase